MGIKRTKYILVLILLIFIRPVFGQWGFSTSQKQLMLGEYMYEKGDFMTAFHLFDSVLKVDTGNYEIIYKAGVCLFSMNKTDTSCIKYFNKSARKIPEARFYLGKIYHFKGLSKKALEELYYFKSINTEENIENIEVTQIIKNCENALKEESKKESYIVKNIGAQVNSKYPEYVPLVWKVNGSLIFTSRREDSKGGLKDQYGRFYEDIYVSQNINETWQSVTPFNDVINTQTHDACVAFSPDGNELLIYRTAEKQSSGDLYISKYDGTKWSEPDKLGSEINSDFLETSACFSADGDEIILSSNRPGGFGGLDLYRVKKFMNGKYSLPFNLGPNINTEFDEDAPFIDKNNNMLYFSSKGHNSIGEYDIFKSNFNKETNRWSSAENLGVPINSSNDDIYFMKLDNKETAFFTSRREGGFGDADIYQINFNESSQLIIFCKINFAGLEKGELKDLQLSLYDNVSGKLEGIFRPNKELCMILIVTLNKPYKLILEGMNIEPVIKNMLFTVSDKEMEIEVIRKVK